MLVQALPALARGMLARQPQPEQGVSYAHKIQKAEAAIDWRQPAAVIERRVRAFDPFPGASFDFDGTSTKLWRAALSDMPIKQAAPGTILHSGEGRLFVACDDAALELLELQRPGGRRVGVTQFLQSACADAIAPGRVLGSAC